MTEKERYRSVLEAVGRGDDSAKTQLAWFMLSGHGGAVFDACGAVKLLSERVEEKDGEAMWMLGLCYEYGIGIEQDIQHSVLLYGESSRRKNEVGAFLAQTPRVYRGTGFLQFGSLNHSLIVIFLINQG